VGTKQAEERAAEPRAGESGLRLKRRLVPVLRQGVTEIRLDRPVLIIGRSTACEVQLTSGLVSRRHARLTLSGLGVSIEDLGSRNGVYVNSAKVTGSTRLKAGDRLSVGDEVLYFAEIDDANEMADTVTDLALPPSRRELSLDDEVAIATRSADVFQLLASIVDKALALGRGEEAERVIGTHLQATLAEAVDGRGVSPDLARTAAGYAVKLAGATGKAVWMDHAVKLYSALGLVLPLALVDEMYVLLRRVRGLDAVVLSAYTDALRRRSAELAPAERFVLQRLLGLERLASWQTNTSV
jgi:pSer/pThr/pTyr-binding forkhead associated (FHA) protein